MILLGAVVITNAQSPRIINGISSGNLNAEDQMNLNIESALDTMIPGSLSAAGCDTPFLYTSASGFVCGTNEYGDYEKAQLYDFTGNGNIVAVLVAFAAKIDIDGGNVIGTAYTSNAGVPDVSLGTTPAVTVSNCDTSGLLTVFMFTSPVAVSDNFFVGFDVQALYATGDSIGAYITKDGCFSGTQRAYEQWSDGTWYPFNDGTNQTWQLDADMFVFPVVNVLGAGVNHISKNELSLFGNYPNPADASTSIQYSLNEASDVSIHIYDASARLIKSVSLGNHAPGVYNHEMNVSDLSEASYFYSINTNNATLFSQMIINR